jgi:hypothetical protein
MVAYAPVPNLHFFPTQFIQHAAIRNISETDLGILAGGWGGPLPDRSCEEEDAKRLVVVMITVGAPGLASHEGRLPADQWSATDRRQEGLTME